MNGILETIAARHSCRTFDGLPLSPDDRSSIEELLAGPHGAPFDSRVRFALLDAFANEVTEARRAPARLGTYGVICGAPCYLAGAVADGPHAREDYGFALERIVLCLTALGWGTCWLGALFRHGAFADRLALAEGEIIPAVTPVGHPAARPRLTDAVIRAGAGSARRRPWEDLFSFGRDEAGPWEPCLEAVRLGPSAANGQPWRVAKDPGRPVFHLGLVASASRSALRRLDAGIAMCHFALAAGELCLEGAWAAPDPARKGRHPLLPSGAVHVASWFPA
jgi:nitroreductase